MEIDIRMLDNGREAPPRSCVREQRDLERRTARPAVRRTQRHRRYIVFPSVVNVGGVVLQPLFAPSPRSRDHETVFCHTDPVDSCGTNQKKLSKFRTFGR